MADIAMPAGTPAITPTCRIRGCTGSWHDDDICDVVLTDLGGPGASLIVEVNVEPGETAELLVWEGDDGRNLIRTRDLAAARSFADKLRALVTAVDQAVDLVAQGAAV